MKCEARLLALLTAPLLALAVSTVAAAEFETKKQYRSIVDTDPAIHQRFVGTFRDHKPQVDEVTEGVYLARGFGQGNAILVEGPTGAVVFDVGDSYENGLAMLAAFREHTDAPIRAVVYSHFHFDHVFGAKAFVDDAGDDVQIVAHASTARYLDERGSALAPRADWGLAMQFGAFLDEGCEVASGPLCSAVAGIQFPRIGSSKGHQRHVLYPNVVFRDELELDAIGLPLRLIHSPSETRDNILLWIPDRKVILSGDTIAPVFPSIVTARGEQARHPQDFLDSLDLIRSLGPEHIVPSHGPAFSGSAAERMVANYRDTIAFVYHQTVRLINRGQGPEEIASTLELPEALANDRLLGQWYNDAQSAIRGIYGLLIGHSHDVAGMALVPPEMADANMIALAGGADAYLDKLRLAFERGDHPWVARAATHLIRLEPDNQAAKALKASALRVMAAQATAGAHRHFYLQHAAALEGRIEIPVVDRLTEDDVSSVPPRSILRNIPFRLNADRAAGRTDRISVRVTDVPLQVTLRLRNRTVVVGDDVGPSPASLSLDSTTLRRFYVGTISLEEGFEDGKMVGDAAEAAAFFSLFDWPMPRRESGRAPSAAAM